MRLLCRYNGPRLGCFDSRYLPKPKIEGGCSALLWVEGLPSERALPKPKIDKDDEQGCSPKDDKDEDKDEVP